MIYEPDRPAFDRAVLLLQIRSHSEAELIQKLMKKGFKQEEITEAILKLKEYHYIDDHKFAVDFITTHFSKDSKRKIVMSLFQKGVDSDITEAAFFEVAESFEVSLEEEALNNSIEKYIRHRSINNDEERQKLMAHLYRKGFSVNNIQRILEQRDLEYKSTYDHNL